MSYSQESRNDGLYWYNFPEKDQIKPEAGARRNGGKQDKEQDKDQGSGNKIKVGAKVKHTRDNRFGEVVEMLTRPDRAIVKWDDHRRGDRNGETTCNHRDLQVIGGNNRGSARDRALSPRSNGTRGARNNSGKGPQSKRDNFWKNGGVENQLKKLISSKKDQIVTLQEEIKTLEELLKQVGSSS